MTTPDVIMFMARYPDDEVETETLKFIKYNANAVPDICVKALTKFYRGTVEIGNGLIEAIHGSVKEAYGKKEPVIICVTKLEGKILLSSYKLKYLPKCFINDKGDILADSFATQMRVFHISQHPLNNPFTWDL